MLLGFIFSINLYCYMCPTSIWLCSVPNLLPYRFHWYLLSTCEAIFHRLWHNNMMYKKSWKDHEWSVLLCDNNIECLTCLLCTSNDAISDLCISKIKSRIKMKAGILILMYYDSVSIIHFISLIFCRVSKSIHLFFPGLKDIDNSIPFQWRDICIAFHRVHCGL